MTDSPSCQVRASARRPVYRRGGLALAAGRWTPVDTDNVSPEQLSALFADPVVLLQAREPGEPWRAVTAAERQDMAAYIAVALADRAVVIDPDADAAAAPPLDLAAFIDPPRQPIPMLVAPPAAPASPKAPPRAAPRPRKRGAAKGPTASS
ncbi:hypothetical protein [Reyranella sp.]|uniref:hypothetical protein n=1 Tax=Reyranella sp. TaxID=1929291 RepID=UPI002731D1B0|nr:hypothetical protein [Reyranella sp.]MDP2373164.1 hypothetical protein [Reyranella sp.]